MTATGARGRSVIPFVQFLAGVAHSSDTLRNLPEPDLLIGSSAFAIQAGGGVDLRVSRHLLVRTSGNVRIDRPQYSIDWHYPEWKFDVGVAYMSGP